MIDYFNYTTSLLRLLLCLMKGERMGRALDSQFNKKKYEGFKVERWPTKTPHSSNPPPLLIMAPVQSFAVMRRSPRPSFVIFIGLLDPPKANGSVFDEGEPLLKFNKPPERVRRRTCLPIGAQLCGQVQKSCSYNVGGANMPPRLLLFGSTLFNGAR